jgi:hypothetical protein
MRGGRYIGQVVGLRRTDARNRRDFYFRHYKAGEQHSLAVPAGKCRCGKITDLYCFSCQRWLCMNHIYTDEEEYYCKDCRPDSSRKLEQREKRKLRKLKIEFDEDFKADYMM